MVLKFLLFTIFLLTATISFAQVDSTKPSEPKTTKTISSKWYDKISVSGYVQARYNRLFETNPKLKCEQCDKSWGENGGIFLRRLRIKFSGQISKQIYFFIQPDFVSSSGSILNIAQLRDAYMDLGFDKKNEFRIRVGQSKIPFGFENMQSSQNRLPLDRNDALNSALSNERDLGAMFYWAPQKARNLFRSLVRDGLKGSGDYGVLGLGVFNGQTANQPDKNEKLHVVARASYPFQFGNQIIEPGIQAYTGKFVLLSTSPGVKKLANSEYTDQRVAASFILYPKPFGIQAEYNIGRGPEFNKATDSIELNSLTGGYATFSYLINKGEQIIIPFTRIQYYSGGKKHELDSRSYKVNEFEIGVEWQPVKAFELVAMYTISNRRFEDFANQNNFQKGSLLRLQAQVNF